MAKSNRVSVSKAKLTETGEELEVAGAVFAIEGVVAMAEGVEDLAVAKVATAVGVAEVASAASDLTRSEDAAVAAERMQQLSDVVGVAGVVDVAQGVDMLLKGGNVRAMGAIVSLMSKEELDRGLELARLAGELWTVSDVVGMLDMPVLSEFLGGRGSRLREIAVDQLLRYTGTRALAGAIKQEGAEIEAMGENEVVEGVVRMAASQAAAERSAELSVASDLLAMKGVDALATAAAAGEVAMAARAAGVTKIAQGAEAIGAGVATAAAGEALAARAG